VIADLITTMIATLSSHVPLETSIGLWPTGVQAAEGEIVVNARISTLQFRGMSGQAIGDITIERPTDADVRTAASMLINRRDPAYGGDIETAYAAMSADEARRRRAVEATGLAKFKFASGVQMTTEEDLLAALRHFWPGFHAEWLVWALADQKSRRQLLQLWRNCAISAAIATVEDIVMKGNPKIGKQIDVPGVMLDILPTAGIVEFIEEGTLCSDYSPLDLFKWMLPKDAQTTGLIELTRKFITENGPIMAVITSPRGFRDAVNVDHKFVFVDGDVSLLTLPDGAACGGDNAHVVEICALIVPPGEEKATGVVVKLGWPCQLAALSVKVFDAAMISMRAVVGKVDHYGDAVARRAVPRKGALVCGQPGAGGPSSTADKPAPRDEQEFLEAWQEGPRVICSIPLKASMRAITG
jgi:hypothetical protein